jgi:hypothetical protein
MTTLPNGYKSLPSYRRTEDDWWAWHDADDAQWSPGEDPDEATADAEARCAAWVRWQSNDGPRQ